jgi:hypothetical protein
VDVAHGVTTRPERGYQMNMYQTRHCATSLLLEDQYQERSGNSCRNEDIGSSSRRGPSPHGKAADSNNRYACHTRHDQFKTRRRHRPAGDQDHNSDEHSPDTYEDGNTFVGQGICSSGR